MTSTAALILTDGVGGLGPVTPGMGDTAIAGLTMTERAALAAHHAGIDRIHLVGAHQPTDRTVQRLRSRGVEVSAVRNQGRPFEAAPTNSLVVVIPVGTVVEPRAVTALLEHAHLRPGEAALAIDTQPDARHRLVKVSNGFVSSLLADGTGASTDLTVLTPEAVAWVRNARSGWEALWALARAGRLRAVSVAPYLCEPLRRATDRADVEHRYIRHLNGNEFWFTKVLRRQSVYLTRALVRTSLSPNQVTVLGLLVAVAAALGFALGGYWPAVAGALLYYLSTLLDCCEGEMARCTFRSSAFGCWLETVSDCASTFLILAGALLHVLTNASRTDALATWVAAIGTTITMAVVAYQRRRLTRQDPDAFERTLHRRFGDGNAGPLGRFIVWGSQYIKRASVAHVVLFLAIIGQLRVVIYLWAFAMLVTVPFLIGVHAVLMGRGRTVPLLFQRRASIGGGAL